MTEYIIQAYKIADEMKHSLKYRQYKQLEKIIEEKYATLIQTFNTWKEKYYTILDEGGKYHPDYLETVKKLSEAKKVLYEKSEVRHYFELEQELQTELNLFIKQITEIISNNIKKPNELGLLKEKGGGCHAN